MMNNWLRFYTSLKGRATRADFNLRTTLVLVAGNVIASGIDTLVFDGQKMPCTTAWNYFGVFLTMAVTARRLHDINLSGWWQVPVQLFTLGIMLAIDLSGIKAETLGDLLPLADKLDNIGSWATLTVLALLIYAIVFFILLSTKHGTKGVNRYGADPLSTGTMQ